MRLEQVIQDMEDPNKHEIVLNNRQLTTWLRELRDARKLIRLQSAVIESQSRYIEQYIKGGDPSCPESND